MKIKIGRVHAAIQKHIRSKSSVAIGMEVVIAICEKSLPHKDWKRLARIDYNADVERLRSWIPRALKKDPPPFVTKGLYFGLCNPGVLNEYGEPGQIWADMYLGLLGQYDARDPRQKWLWGKLRHYPSDSYAWSKALRQIYRIAYADEDEGLGNEAEYPLCLAFGAFAVRSILENEGVESPIGVVVGFDEGDRLKLGKSTKAGFVANRRAMI